MTESERPARPNRGELAVGFLRDRLMTVVFLVVGGFLVASYYGVELTVPRPVRLFAIVVMLLGPVGFAVGNWVVSHLNNPSVTFLVDVDARDVEAGLYRFPGDSLAEFDVVDGDLDRPTPWLVFGKNVDLANKTVEGCWRGTLSDRELLKALNKIDECRGQLEDDARKGFALRNRGFSIVRQAVRREVENIVSYFEDSTLAEGDSIDDMIREAVDDDVLTSLELGDEFDDLDPDPDPDGDLADDLEETGKNGDTPEDPDVIGPDAADDWNPLEGATDD